MMMAHHYDEAECTIMVNRDASFIVKRLVALNAIPSALPWSFVAMGAMTFPPVSFYLERLFVTAPVLSSRPICPTCKLWQTRRDTQTR